ncbi:MAG: GrpB family protein [bacterium]
MPTKQVFIVPYDPNWIAQFQKIRTEVAAALGPLALAIEHVGSTSVPGLVAKPVIDIDVVIERPDVFDVVKNRLETIGYFDRGDLGIPGREAFGYLDKPHLMKHHLYVCSRDSDELQRHVAFRDFLRSHPEDAAEYARIKAAGAKLYPEDIEGYILHKTPFIQNILKRISSSEE